MSSAPAGTTPLKGKAAVVTGASRGIGRAIALALAVEGCHLAICARDRETLSTTAADIAKIGPEAFWGSCDVTQPEQVERFFAAVHQRLGKIDVLVNNAGMAHPLVEIRDMPLDVWNVSLATNLTGTFLCTQAALPHLTEGGTIVNVLSATVHETFKGMAAYAAAKHGVLSFSNVLREELRGKGIRVLALIPGATRTDIWQQFWPEAPRDKMLAPETVAAAVVHALQLPLEATIEEIRIGPSVGRL